MGTGALVPGLALRRRCGVVALPALGRLGALQGAPQGLLARVGRPVRVLARKLAPVNGGQL